MSMVCIDLDAHVVTMVHGDPGSQVNAVAHVDCVSWSSCFCYGAS